MIVAAVLVLQFGYVSGDIAAAGGEQGSGNGLPFKTLQSEIDALEADFDAAVADLQAQIDDLVASQAEQDEVIAAIQTAASLLQERVATNEEDIAALQEADNFQNQLIQALDDRLVALEARVTANEGDIAALILADQTMQMLIGAIQVQMGILDARITANDGDIAALQTEIATLNGQLNDLRLLLAEKQDRIIGICGTGSSIRVINADGSVECQIDNVSAGVGTLQRKFAFAAGRIPRGGSLELTAMCLSTHVVTGGGYTLHRQNGAVMRLIHVRHTFGGVPVNGWTVDVSNGNLIGRSGLTVIANCTRVQ